eukprot:1146781-Pelagomonas_calceolata.AAC.3
MGVLECAMQPDGRMEVMGGPPPLSAFAPDDNGLTNLQDQTQTGLMHDETVGCEVDADGWQVHK